MLVSNRDSRVDLISTASSTLPLTFLPFISKASQLIAKSNFHTVGILYADIVGYLAARIDTISNELESASLHGKKLNVLKKAFSFIGTHTSLSGEKVYP